MYITVRLWNQKELEAVKSDKWLATLLMNGKSFSEAELKARQSIPSKDKKTYDCTWYADSFNGGRGDNDEVNRIMATDEKMLARFIDAEYTRRPNHIYQVITQYKPVYLS